MPGHAEHQEMLAGWVMLMMLNLLTPNVSPFHHLSTGSFLSHRDVPVSLLCPTSRQLVLRTDI